LKRKKKIAIGIITVGIIIILLDSVNIPWLPVPMSPLEYLRNYLLLFYDIELPRVSLSPGPEIIPKGKIAFAVIPDYDYGSIYIAEADGENITLFIKDIRIRGDIAWSPDGKKIAFVGSGRIPPDSRFYLVDMQGKIRTLAYLSLMHVDNLEWAPDGRIVFEATVYQKIDGNTTGLSGMRIGNTFYAIVGSDIYIMNADGTNITKIIEKGSNPTWSPDGKYILFISEHEDEYGTVYIMNTNDGNMIKSPVQGNYPVWSPDGKKIAFVRSIPETEKIRVPQIFVINIDGSNLTMLTHFRSEDFVSGEYSIGELSYSPDGRKIAFTMGRWKDTGKGYFVRYSEIYIMNADGTNLIRLAEGSCPTWSLP